MGAIMLIEIWERLRGYDKWIQTEATVASSTVEETKQTVHGQPAPSTWASGDELVWTDRLGQRQSAEFTVPDDSPLYQLIGGEKVTIRYNPAQPERFYYRELLRTRVHTAVKTAFGVFLFAGAVAWLFWFR
jgi:hypothetical protein